MLRLLTSLYCRVFCSAGLMSVQGLTRAEPGGPGVAGVTRVYDARLRMIPVTQAVTLTQAGAPCSLVSVYASLSVTTWPVGDGGHCPGRVSPLPDTLRSPLHHSPVTSHPEKGDTDTDSRPRQCDRCGVAQVSSLDTSHLWLRIPQIVTREETRGGQTISKMPLLTPPLLT